MISKFQRDNHAIRWLERLVTASPDPAYFFDMKEHTILAVNHKVVDLLGFRWQELLKKKIEDLRPPEDAPSFLHKLNGPYPPDFAICSHLTKNGAKLPVQVIYRENYCLDGDGREHHVCLVVIKNSEAIVSSREMVA